MKIWPQTKSMNDALGISALYIAARASLILPAIQSIFVFNNELRQDL